MSTVHAPETLKFKRQPQKKRLNKRTVEALKMPPEANGRPAQAWTYDTEISRLAICTWSTGAKAWYWVGRITGSFVRIKLGDFPEITPEQASKLAAKTSANVANSIDPRKERQKARQEMTLAELFSRYLDEHAKQHKKTWQEDEDQFRLYCQSIKSSTLSSIDRSAITALHAKIGKNNGKYSANRLLALLSKMFGFAQEIGYEGGNPCKGVKKFKEQSRERFMVGDELQRFFESLQQEPQLFQDFFSLLLLTGARKRNVLAMRFEEVDLTERTWRIPETKNGNPLTVHLAADAVAILQRRLAVSNGCQWVFQGGKRNRETHLQSPKKAWARICQRAGLANLRMHDLRRTLGSWQAATGASLPIIGKTLGHLNQSTTTIYARLNIDPVREAVDAAVAAMMTAAKKGEDTDGAK